MKISEIKILKMPVKDRTKRRPMRPTLEDEEEVLIPILKVVLIAGHLRQNQDIWNIDWDWLAHDMLLMLWGFEFCSWIYFNFSSCSPTPAVLAAFGTVRLSWSDIQETCPQGGCPSSFLLPSYCLPSPPSPLLWLVLASHQDNLKFLICSV